VTFVESLPSELAAGDFVQNLSQGPKSMHFKNVRMGNHHYNILDIKGSSIVVEDSFFYNSTMGAIDIVPDFCGYWCEGTRSDNIIIRNNVFSRTNTAVMIQTTGPTGTAASLQSTTLVDSSRNVTISNNTIYYNATNIVTTDTWPHQNVPIILSGVTDFHIVKNVIWTNPGARNDISLMQLCNVQDGVISGNKILHAPFVSWKGGYLCTTNEATNCPAYPVNKTLGWMTASSLAGCSATNTRNVTIAGDNTWQNGESTKQHDSFRKRDGFLRG
jgi:hypothetical protein